MIDKDRNSYVLSVVYKTLELFSQHGLTVEEAVSAANMIIHRANMQGMNVTVDPEKIRIIRKQQGLPD